MPGVTVKLGEAGKTITITTHELEIVPVIAHRGWCWGRAKSASGWNASSHLKQPRPAHSGQLDSSGTL
jgi:hypothetical protein